MDLFGASLIVVADGAHARLFEERRRGGALIDITPRLGDLSAGSPMASAFAGRVHDRMGPASHTIEKPTPADRREEAFLDRVAAGVATVMARGEHKELVLLAGPRSLGRLRRALGRRGLTAVASEAHDRVGEDAETLRTRLRDLRRTL